MAKGQVRSNRETRKPKQNKTDVKATAATLGSQVKQAASTTATGSKGKK